MAGNVLLFLNVVVVSVTVPVRERCPLLSLVDFGAIDHDAAWRFDAKSHLIANHSQNRDCDFVPDVDSFHGTSREFPGVEEGSTILGSRGCQRKTHSFKKES